MHSIHKSAFRKQDRTLFTGSHVHTSFSCVCLIHSRANILQVHVKHHVNWFTSRSSIASSNVHISFTLADLVQTVPPMQFIPAYHFHKCNSVHKFTSISYTQTHRSTVQMCTSRYTTKSLLNVFEAFEKFLENLVRSELLNP